MFFVIFPGKLQMMNDFVYEYQTHVYTTFFGSLIIVCEITCVMCVEILRVNFSTYFWYFVASLTANQKQSSRGVL